MARATVELNGVELDAQDLLDAARVVERDGPGHGAAHRGDVIVMDDGCNDQDARVGKLDYGKVGGLYDVNYLIEEAEHALTHISFEVDDDADPRLVDLAEAINAENYSGEVIRVGGNNFLDAQTSGGRFGVPGSVEGLDRWRLGDVLIDPASNEEADVRVFLKEK